jgi:hypothetical protein
MRRKSRESEFLDLIDYWLDYFNIDNVIVQRDNRGPGLASIEDDDLNDEFIFRYSWKQLRYCRNHTRLSAVLHEIGHIIQKLPYRTETQKIQSEYHAERFALDVMKEKHPVHYRNECKRMQKSMSSEKYRKHLDRVHLLAFQQIEEYNAK